MNAVTTAEYVVLEYLGGQVLQEEINSHAAQGYRLLSFNTVPSTPEHDMTLTAVMVRESDSTKVTPKQLSDLQTAFGNLLTRIQNLEERIEDIEAKIDWSK